MNLIEGGRPRIGCIRRQPSAGSLILSLEEGHPSMGKMAGSSGQRGRTSGAPQLPGARYAGRGDGVQAVPLAAGTDRAVTCEKLSETKSLKKFGSGLIRRSHGASSKNQAATGNEPSSSAWGDIRSLVVP